MSKINGDKARFHKGRKEKIQRRIRNKAMYQALTGKSNETSAPVSKSK